MKDWRKIQRENFTSLEKLIAFLELDEFQKEELMQIRAFPLNLPKRLADKIEKRKIDDPIFKQFVPTKKELAELEGFSLNPVGDVQARLAPKCLQKYEGRVLLLPTSACAMHCRYCFRRFFSYDEIPNDFSSEMSLIQIDPSIKEVILSGGDPLSLSNRVLATLVQKLGLISHVKRIRFHSRFLIGIPERIDAEFLSILESSAKKIWFVIHCNHIKELDEDVKDAIKKIQKLGIVVLNQAVLLHGVNDTLESLQELFEALVDLGVLPYYLHQLDKVQGSAHFEVAEEKALSLMEELKKKVSGYALPKYVKEVAGEFSKHLLFS